MAQREKPAEDAFARYQYLGSRRPNLITFNWDILPEFREIFLSYDS
jgi:hypothetical protein